MILQVSNGGKTGYVVVNKNSLLKRLGLNSQDLKNVIKKNKDSDVTEIVNKKITHIHLVTEAERQFSFHPLREEILERVNEALPDVIESSTYTFGSARIYKTKEEAKKEGAIEDALESFFRRKDLFPKLKINKYGGSVLAKERMKQQILEAGDAFVKSSKSIPEGHQKDVLNYIRQVAYSRDFLKDPAAYINQWIEDRGNEEIYMFVQDPALEFFKGIQFVSTSEVMTEAERQFSFHPLREEILERVNEALPEVIESSTYTFGSARIYKTKEEAKKEGAIEDALESFFRRKDLFPNLKINKYGGSVLAKERMKHQVLKAGENFVKETIPEEKQKDVLNYIRQVTYSRDFLNDPSTYINKLMENSGKGNVFPADAALDFFKLVKFE